MDWLTQLMAAAVGFLFAFFYSRTMRAADQAPEKYVSKHDCETTRSECRRNNEFWRDEVLQRLERMELKMDRVVERISAQYGNET
ncbi:MAG: hypothetical protein ACYDFU_07980 [Nitrospirota bacterium]